jgi:hypothetical protein
MLAALNVSAVALGVAGGGLMATIVALGLGGLLSVVNVPNGADLGLLVGILVGLVFGGWLAGRFAVHSHRFHGSIVGLAITALIVLLASLGAAEYRPARRSASSRSACAGGGAGSPASTTASWTSRG